MCAEMFAWPHPLFSHTVRTAKLLCIAIIHGIESKKHVLISGHCYSSLNCSPTYSETSLLRVLNKAAIHS